MEKLYGVLNLSLTILFLLTLLFSFFTKARVDGFKRILFFSSYLALLLIVFLLPINGIHLADYINAFAAYFSVTLDMLMVVYVLDSLFYENTLFVLNTSAPLVYELKNTQARHCERSEAIQAFQKSEELDCHVANAPRSDEKRVMIYPANIFNLNFKMLMILLALTTLFLYPISILNITVFEPYSLGYNAVFIPAFYLLLILILCWFNLRYWPLFLLVVFTVVLYLFKFPQGDNFWNYWIDPILGLYACGWVILKYKK
jgi:hypothetical protein